MNPLVREHVIIIFLQRFYYDQHELILDACSGQISSFYRIFFESRLEGTEAGRNIIYDESKAESSR